LKTLRRLKITLRRFTAYRRQLGDPVMLPLSNLRRPTGKIATPWMLTALLLLAGGWAAGQEAETPAQLAARIDRLIQQLDDDKFEIRERAEADLAAIGEAALAKAEAAKQDSSAERSQRAAKVAKRIREARVGLRYVSSICRADLAGPVSVSVSSDGQFVYTSSFHASGLHVFKRDAISGSLEHIQLLTDRMALGMPMCIRITPDGNWGIAACRGSSTIVLLRRDENNGTLEQSDIIRKDQNTEVAPSTPVDAAFSPDSRFVYVVDQAGVVFVLRIADDKLRHVETFRGPDNCLLQACGIAMNPPGTLMFVVSATASTLSVFRRDTQTGKLSLLQVVKDEKGEVRGLGGVFGVCCSPDGNHVYTCSGLPGKDNAITAFRVIEDGRVALLQEFISDQSDLVNYNRANEITVTPDGLSVYTSGTQSRSLACFDRDPKSGTLTYRATVQNEGTGATFTAGPTGLAASPDSRFLYVTIEGGQALSVFERTVTRR
jgi:6-phosphogluconolactonase (cycloisomerase 2 family)